MSLRVRLLAGLAALVIFGLAAFGTGTYISLKGFLIDRLDQQLGAAAKGAQGALFGFGGPLSDQPRPDEPDSGPTRAAVHAAVGPDLFVEVLGPDGRVGYSVPSSSNVSSPPTIDAGVVPLPAAAGTPSHQSTADSESALVGAPGAAGSPVSPEMPLQDPAPARSHGYGPDDQPGSQRTITTASTASGSERVVLLAAPGFQTIAVAGSLRPVAQTLHRLLLVELSIGGGVLLLTLALGVALARQATRPLEAIAATADSIAAGDLSRRVDDATDSSEVGRVGVAINAMLNEIEGAFKRRDASESRLRRFVADASHELSTPLTSIRGYAELFHRGLASRPEDLAKAMERIESEGARMGGLVDDLLLLASMDNGRPLQRDPVDLNRIAADTAADLRAAAPDRSVSVESGGPVIVLGDEDRLRQVAANLASNARRHTPPGTAVTLRTRVADGTGILEVADDGPGLSEQAAAHVFDRFYRVDKARARADGGTGLGLSIVATIAEALDGRASLDTAEGQGATFSIAIPLALPHGPADDPAS
jgi:two-component system OmpR family sensor kinase